MIVMAIYGPKAFHKVLESAHEVLEKVCLDFEWNEIGGEWTS